MSLRWIHENLVPPNVDEECSDIDDSCSDGSYDSDVLPAGDDNGNNINSSSDNNNAARVKRESLRHPTTTVTIDEFGKHHLKTEDLEKSSPSCIPWHLDQAIENLTCQSLKVKLFCRTGYFIGITASGRAKGFSTDSTNDALVRLVICPVSPGVIRLQSAETGHYLAFNSTGHLYGEVKANKDNTEWEQWNIGNYDAFRSRKYSESSWWLGIKRNGRHKPGHKTAWGQKAIQFLPIRLA